MSQFIQYLFAVSGLLIASLEIGMLATSLQTQRRNCIRWARARTTGSKPEIHNPGRAIDPWFAHGATNKFKAVRAPIFALLLFVTGVANAQTVPPSNAPRPLDALGMTYEKLSSYLGSCQKECKQHAKEAKLGYRTTFELPPYSYTVEAGKVIEVMITADSFEGFLDEGKEKWGPPTSLAYQVLVSPEGKESRSGTARWELPGGTIVDARQTPVPGKVLGVTKLYLGGQTVYLTQKESPTEGAMVIITNASAQRTEKPKPSHVL